MPQLRLPEGVEQYVEMIHERAYSLIRTGVWSGFDQQSLGRWLNQFRLDQQRLYLSARLLDALIYRSTEQTMALIQQLLQRCLPLDIGANLQEHDPMRQDWTLLLRDAQDSAAKPLRIVPVVAANGRPHKSGTQLVRTLKRDFKVDERLIIAAERISDAINEGARRIVCIDDFVGTGDQFIEFANTHRLASHAQAATIHYAPLTAYAQGMVDIQAACPYLSISCAERLNESHSFFAPSSAAFTDDPGAVSEAREYYLSAMDEFGLSEDEALGYGRLQFTYVFENATPDNNLGALWKSTDTFHALFRR